MKETFSMLHGQVSKLACRSHTMIYGVENLIYQNYEKPIMNSDWIL